MSPSAANANAATGTAPVGAAGKSRRIPNAVRPAPRHTIRCARRVTSAMSGLPTRLEAADACGRLMQAPGVHVRSSRPGGTAHRSSPPVIAQRADSSPLHAEWGGPPSLVSLESARDAAQAGGNLGCGFTTRGEAALVAEPLTSQPRQWTRHELPDLTDEGGGLDHDRPSGTWTLRPAPSCVPSHSQVIMNETRVAP